MREDDELEGDVDQREREIDAYSEDEESNERDEDDDGAKESTVVDDSETNGDDDNDDLDSVMAEADDGDASESVGDEASTGTPATSEERDNQKKEKKKSFPVSANKPGHKGRTPSVAGLTIPFRTVKKAMKLDPDTPIVQNEAAIMATFAAELFLKRLAKESFHSAKLRGRNTIRYEDIAEARTKNASMTFLETLFP